jgi:type I pantothenate kinase
VLFGITGGVAVGKSTTAALVHRHLVAEGVTVDLLCTDAFLLPNDELERRGLTLRKGFPESFDTASLGHCLRQLREGARSVTVPVYSHATYNRVPGATAVLGGADVVIVEGVNVLQPGVADELTLSVYVDAEEPDMRRWFLDRFIDLCARSAEDEGATFYRSLLALSPDERHAVADGAWSQINRVNLADHIAPSRVRATFVLHKAGDHSVRALVPQG